MKQSISVLIIVLCFSAFSWLDAEQARKKREIALIRDTVQLYVGRAGHDRATDLRQAFHPDAKLLFTNDNGYNQLPFPDWVARIEQSNRPPVERTESITSIDVAGNAAVARVDLGYADTHITDYLSLLKIDGEWKIVNKIFTRIPKDP